MEASIGLISWDIETSIRSIEEYFGVEVNDENEGRSTISGYSCILKAIDSDTLQENLDIAIINLLWEEDQGSVDPVMSRYQHVPIRLYLTRNSQNIAEGWRFNAQIVSINQIDEQIQRSLKDLAYLQSILRRLYQELVGKSYSEVQGLMGDLQGDVRDLIEIGNLSSFDQFWTIWRQRPRDKSWLVNRLLYAMILERKWYSTFSLDIERALDFNRDENPNVINWKINIGNVNDPLAYADAGVYIGENLVNQEYIDIGKLDAQQQEAFLVLEGSAAPGKDTEDARDAVVSLIHKLFSAMLVQGFEKSIVAMVPQIKFRTKGKRFYIYLIADLRLLKNADSKGLFMWLDLLTLVFPKHILQQLQVRASISFNNSDGPLQDQNPIFNHQGCEIEILGNFSKHTQNKLLELTALEPIPSDYSRLKLFDDMFFMMMNNYELGLNIKSIQDAPAFMQILQEQFSNYTYGKLTENLNFIDLLNNADQSDEYLLLGLVKQVRELVNFRDVRAYAKFYHAAASLQVYAENLIALFENILAMVRTRDPRINNLENTNYLNELRQSFPDIQGYSTFEQVSLPSEPFVLMVSAKLIPKALDFGQTCWNCIEILIFTGSAAYQARWKPQYSKIGGIYDNFPYLFQRLEQIRLLSQNIPQALNLALGAVYGAFIGDSIGSYVEFSHAVSAEDIAQAFALEGGGPHRIGPGQVTDDSELAISLARGLLYSENQVLNLDQITKFYGEWIKSNPFDVGNTTANALIPLRNGHSADRAIRSARYQNQRSISNGSMMRCTPMAIWAHRLPKERIVEVAKLESSITHSNATAQNATACYVFAITYLINHPGDRQGAYQAAKQLGGELGLADWFDDIENQRLPQGHPKMGYVKIGFTHAFHHLRQGSDYDTAIRQVLAIAGDTDTNAAIVGGLIGAAVGFNALSEDYKLKIEARAGDQSLRIERPDFLIPRDLKHLVTRLYELAPMDVNKVVIANRELNLGEEFQ